MLTTRIWGASVVVARLVSMLHGRMRSSPLKGEKRKGSVVVISMKDF